MESTLTKKLSTTVNKGRQCTCLDTVSHSCRASPPASQSDAPQPRLFSSGPVAIIRYRYKFIKRY